MQISLEVSSNLLSTENQPMLNKAICIVVLLTFVPIFSAANCAEKDDILLMGSTIDATSDVEIANARIIYQIDTLRFHQRLTDNVGFFMIKLPGAYEGKLFKYYLEHENYLPEKGAYIIQAINDPLTFRMHRDSSSTPRQPMKIEGCVKSADDRLPIIDANLFFRIGEIILPDTTTDENGCFSLPLTPDDLGKVMTYQFLKNGYSPRYGYARIEKETEFLDIRMQKWIFTVSGYVKNSKNGKPVAAARVVFDYDATEPIVKLASKWGYFTHTFTDVRIDGLLKIQIEKEGYFPFDMQLEPKNEQETQLDVKLVPIRSKPPFLRNRIFWFGAAGVAAIAASIYLIMRGDDEQPESADLPFPPIPPM
ncbi:hypothetical protein JXJ21_20025 [candidate division KSB1 bacterium]|nr:hypothetical protein [candidate division KSB1 bacterium]